MKGENAGTVDLEVAGTTPARRRLSAIGYQPSAFDDRCSIPTRHSSSSLVYGLLLAMAVATFAPCVLLPEWRQLQVLRLVEAAERARVAEVKDLLARERRLLEAMTTDPAVATRLAQRELNYRRANERAVPVVGVANCSASAFGSLLEEPERTIQPLATCWPDIEFDRVFCGERTRPVIMGMSVALAGGAFLLFGMRKEPDPRPRNPCA